MQARTESNPSLDLTKTTLGFLIYAFLAISLTVVLIKHWAPKFGRQYVVIYIAICSLVGSLSVMACKGLGIALKLTFG